MMDVYHEIAIRECVRYILGQTSIGTSIYPKSFLKSKRVRAIIKDELELLEAAGKITVYDKEEAVTELLLAMGVKNNEHNT